MQAERDESSNDDNDDDSGEYVDDLESEEGSHSSPAPSQPSRDCHQQEAILKKALARIQRLDQLLADRSKVRKINPSDIDIIIQCLVLRKRRF